MQRFIQILKNISEGRLSPIYVVAGDELFQIEELLCAIRQQLSGNQPGEREFLDESFDGGAAGVEGLLSAVQELPGLFDAVDSKRLIICRRFDKAPAAVTGQLDSYWDNPNPSTILVLLVSKLDRRRAWVKKIEKLGVVLEVKEPFVSDWPRWQPYVERKLRKRFGSGVWARLQELTEGCLQAAWLEAQKLSCFAGTDAVITVDMVERAGFGVSSGDLFGFCEDLVGGKLVDANTEYRQLVLSGESEVKLVALLVRHVRQLRLCRQLVDRGVTETKAVAAQLHIPFFAVGKLIDQASRMSAVRLDALLAKLGDLDHGLKTGAEVSIASLLMRTV